MSFAKAHHIAGHSIHNETWSDELAVAVKDATRSVQRGLGNARQSQPLDVHRVHSLQLDAAPVSNGGPISPGSNTIDATLLPILRQSQVSSRGTFYVPDSDKENGHGIRATRKT